MPIVIEKEGKTVSEATIAACEELGLSRNDVQVEVLEEGSKGVLGIGSKMARVRVTVNSPTITEKGLKAKRVLESILSHFVNSFMVELAESNDQIQLNIRCGEDKAILIGRRGENIGALEYIVGKIASRITENGREKKVYIDVDGYKGKREETLEKIVMNAVKKAKKTGKPVTLEPMPAYERKMVYTMLKRTRGVKTETKEEGDQKRITIIPSRRPSREKEAGRQA